MIGKTLGHYRVLQELGRGGMGEVFLADDISLERKVALKFLPEVFTGAPERMARFEREAKLLASLNHPNIAAIYGLEQAEGKRFLVLELVEGETLAQRLSKGPLPVEEALGLCRQIAEGLEAAHEKGVIHRDLKPANVMIAAGDKVKILDFGLAKALADETQSVDSSQSPTLTEAMTRPGVILGTAAYMSPEQAKGKAVDKRADIWAFGCILYECLAGKRAFEGETVTETLAAVLTKELDLGKVPAKVHPLLRRCLEKDPKKRLRDIGDMALLLEAAPATVKARWPWLAWGVAAVLLVALALGAVAYFQRTPEEPRTMRFFVSLPETWRLNTSGSIPKAPLVVSPDGHQIAFLASSADGKDLLWVRSLDTLIAQPLAGTESAVTPFWSPDSRFLGFLADGKLKKIDISGGPPITLCDAPNNLCGTWSRDGVIIFGSMAGGLEKVSASGGVSTPATVPAQGESVHAWPFFLPDGRHFLYRVLAGQAGGPIYVSSLDSTERKLLLNAASANAIYAKGHLLFLSGKTLMAQPFDTRRLELTGDAFPIAEQIKTENMTYPYGVFSASENGVLAYQAAAAAGSQLMWFDRTGKQIATLGDPGAYNALELSPDGKRASVMIADKGTPNIWLYDVGRGLRTRFTFDLTGVTNSIWSPDGGRIVFNSGRKGHHDLYQKASSGAGTEEMLLQDNTEKSPYSWSPDGRFIIYETLGNSGTGFYLFVLPLFGDRKPFSFQPTPFNEGLGQFSPDGRWVAYVSNESGRYEVYVAPFPGPGGKWLISSGGGGYPRWRRDGAEIFYLASDDKLMAAAVNVKGSSFEVSAVKPLFQTRPAGSDYYQYDVTADGQRFLINTVPEQTTSAPITVVVNWTAGLNK